MIISKKSIAVELKELYSIFNVSWKFFNNGDMEYLIYKNPLIKNYNGGRGGMGKEITKERKELYKYQARMRAGSRIRELIKENNLRYHWTLTYKENMTDRKTAVNDFNLFMKRLNYRLKWGSLAYVAVMERQKRGAIHFHLALNKRIEFETMGNVWGLGFVMVSQFSGELDRVAGYMSKYLKKEMENDLNDEGDKLYFNSKGLARPKKGQGMLTSQELQEIKNIAVVSVDFEDTSASWHKVQL